MSQSFWGSVEIVWEVKGMSRSFWGSVEIVWEVQKRSKNREKNRTQPCSLYTQSIYHSATSRAVAAWVPVGCLVGQALVPSARLHGTYSLIQTVGSKLSSFRSVLSQISYCFWYIHFSILVNKTGAAISNTTEKLTKKFHFWTCGRKKIWCHDEFWRRSKSKFRQPCHASRSLSNWMKCYSTIRDNGIQTDKEIQNPVSEPKIAAHTPILFAVWIWDISHWWISKFWKKTEAGLWFNLIIFSDQSTYLSLILNSHLIQLAKLSKILQSHVTYIREHLCKISALYQHGARF